ncbi:diguanylate cyclase (GGDEF)-like protein [Paraburkholderia bannensis]|uniref:Diguanylate cyclase (GGDEF)-like protein n=1 Tax=Paraburkholderia bannensis TaxID=765414 RepID=A0A7W9TZG0_9BURK|nr:MULTISPECIES: bifunctional diguanylate cyclase/phosphodiesterase [Paraburkholderia]MBB3259222.1 diguanylate cyclase (GGDEF)-like protein [Paraburkholderia sp. WP4_3_2]MBB6104237.1 diguanylate cyclase (GGDEF)-like protein [Paraburkholderia bannensis]
MGSSVFALPASAAERNRFHARSLEHQRPLSFVTMALSIGAYALFAGARAQLVAAPFPVWITVLAGLGLVLLVLAIPRSRSTAEFGLIGAAYVVIMQLAGNALVRDTGDPLVWMTPAVVAITLCAAPLWLTPRHFLLGSVCYYASTVPFVLSLPHDVAQLAIFGVWVVIAFTTAVVFHFGFYHFRYRHFKLEEALTALAATDALTGVMNRRAFLDEAARFIATRHKSGRAVALLFVDIDQFKSINEQFGHGAGDKALQNVADAIVQHAPEGALIARMGGEEFVVLVEEQPPTPIAGLAQSLRHAIAQIERPDGFVTVSIGVARMQGEGGDDLAALLERADEALFRAKQAGRNQVAFERGASLVAVRNTAANDALPQTVAPATMLRPRWRDVALVSHFQPLWSLPREKLIGIEALLRGEDGQGALVPPAVLFGGLSAAELGELDVLAHRCHLQSAAGRLPEGARLFLNILPSTFIRPGYEAELASMVDAAGLAPGDIVLELLESDDAGPDALSLAANRYRDCGFLIAVDDFGARYSNLDRLLRIQPDLVKLDGELIRARNRRSGRPLLRDLVTLLHQSDIVVVVEGVETTEELVLAVEAKVDIAQGFLLGRPNASPAPASTTPTRIDHAFDLAAEARAVRMSRFDCAIQPWLSGLAEASRQVQAGVPYAESLARLLAGRQCVRAFALGPTGRPALFEARGAARTEPPMSLHNGSDAAGGRWDHRAFFWKATHKNGQAVYSGPMLSPLTGCLCVIASIAIDVGNQQVLIAVELDWASPDLPWPEAA